MELPFLEGQPGWVVVMVVALVVSGGVIGVALRQWWQNGRITAAGRHGESAPGEATLGVLQLALEHLADTAKREAEQGERAEKESRKLREQLREASREITDLRSKLSDCERRAHELAMRAWGSGDRGDES